MDKKVQEQRAFFEKGHAVIVTAYFPPLRGGTSVVMKNLLKGLDKKSYSIATINPGFAKGSKDTYIYYLMNTFVWSSKIDRYWKDIFIKSAIKKLVQLCKDKKVKYIIGVYPDFHFMKIAYETALITGIPLISYLHDTIAEGLTHTRLCKRALKLQKLIFDRSAHIFVISEGLKSFYKEKYNIVVDTLEHSYPEETNLIRFNPNIKDGNIFWGGSIYSINRNSVRRISMACLSLGVKLEFTSKSAKGILDKQDFDLSVIEFSYYNREEYLDVLSKQQILLLALDWPDESSIHRDELSTIFPTKTIEYLYSGRPILIHCPKNYFLSQFFLKYNCGLVVSERSVEKLMGAINELRFNSDKVHEMVLNASKATLVFNHIRLQNKFIAAINALFNNVRS